MSVFKLFWNIANHWINLGLYKIPSNFGTSGCIAVDWQQHSWPPFRHYFKFLFLSHFSQPFPQRMNSYVKKNKVENVVFLTQKPEGIPFSEGYTSFKTPLQCGPPCVVITRKTFCHRSGSYYTHFCRVILRNSMVYVTRSGN